MEGSPRFTPDWLNSAVSILSKQRFHNRAESKTMLSKTHRPFYFLAAKLWLMISLYRISAETPEALSSCKAEIFDLATSSELPHVGIREYAKRALLHWHLQAQFP